MGSWAAREAGVKAIQSMGDVYLFCAISGVYLITQSVPYAPSQYPYIVIENIIFMCA